MDSPLIKSARNHVSHLEKLIAEWTLRRDEGDCVPDAETLTRWIAHTKGEVVVWKRNLESAIRAEREA